MNSIKHTINSIEYEIEWELHDKVSVEYKCFYDDNGEKMMFLSGYVRWDGCSNWRFDEQEVVMLHACTQKGLLVFAQLPMFCWAHASIILEDKFIGELE